MTTIVLIDRDRRLADQLQGRARGLRVLLFPPDTHPSSLYADQPDLVVLSADLRAGEVVSLSRSLRTDPRLPVTRVVALEGRWSTSETERVSESAHVLISAKSAAAIWERVESLLSGSRLADAMDEVIEIGAIRVARESYAVRINGVATQLTAGEYRLLWALASNAGRVLSVGQLSQLGGRLLEPPTPRTIRARVVALRRKLGPAAHQLQNVRGNGYRLVPP